jgi:hypothetical protein
VITAVLGSGGLGAIVTYRAAGLGNGNGFRAQVLTRLDRIVENTGALSGKLEDHEALSAATRRDVAILLDRSNQRRASDRET